MYLCSLQFWTCPCAKTHMTLMTSLQCPSTQTLPSGAPKPAAWRSPSSPGPALPPFAPESTPGALSRQVVRTQVVAASPTTWTATLWATNPPPPTLSPTVTPSPQRTATRSPWRPPPRAARTRLPPSTPSPRPFPPPAPPRAPPTARPRCPRCAKRPSTRPTRPSSTWAGRPAASLWKRELAPARHWGSNPSSLQRNSETIGSKPAPVARPWLQSQQHSAGPVLLLSNDRSTHWGKSPKWEPQSLQALYAAALETSEWGTVDGGIAAFEPKAGANFIPSSLSWFIFPFEGAEYRSLVPSSDPIRLLTSPAFISHCIWSVTIQWWIRRLAQLHLPVPLCKLKAFRTVGKWSAILCQVFLAYIFSRFMNVFSGAYGRRYEFGLNVQIRLALLWRRMLSVCAGACMSRLIEESLPLLF